MASHFSEGNQDDRRSFIIQNQCGGAQGEAERSSHEAGALQRGADPVTGLASLG